MIDPKPYSESLFITQELLKMQPLDTDQAFNFGVLHTSNDLWQGIQVRTFPVGILKTPVLYQYGCDTLELQLQGSAEMRRYFEGRKEQFRVVAGDTCLLPSDSIVGYFAKGSGIALGISLLPEFVRQVAADIGCDKPECAELVARFNFRDPLIEQIGLALLGELQTPSPTGKVYAESLAHTLTAHLLRNYSTLTAAPALPSSGLTRQQLSRVKEFIDQQLDCNLALADIAAAAELSASHFSRLFKQTTGLAPHQYVIQARVERARALLLEGEMTIAEVASEVGFADQSHLTRHFKRILGILPKTVLSESKNAQPTTPLPSTTNEH